MAPLIDNPNAPNKDGETPISRAALNGQTKIDIFPGKQHGLRTM